MWMLFDPLLTFYATNVYTETLFITLLTGTLAIAWSQKYNSKWWKVGIMGLMMGFNTLIKPWILALVGIIIFWWLINKNKKTILQQIKLILPWTAILILGIFIALTPWTIHNIKTSGHVVSIPINGPVNFYLANHKYGESAFTSNYKKNETWAPFEGMDEYDKAQKAKELSKQYVMEDPKRFIKKIWTSFITYWSHPNKQWYQRLVPHFNSLITYLWIKWILVIGGLIYSFKNWKKHSANYLFLGLITAVYTMATYLARFKIPIIPFQIIYASATILLVYNIIKQIFKSTNTKKSTD